MTRCITAYDKPFTIESLTGTTADAHGHPVPTTESNWTKYTTGYADCVSKGGREFWKVQQTVSDVSHVWYTPWTTKLSNATPEMRLIHENTTYEIVSVIDIDNDHQEIEIQTKRAV